MKTLDESEIAKRLGSIPHWDRKGDAITRSWRFPGFRDAVRFVDRVADLAESADHHPDIDIRYDRVTLTLSTHSAGGLTRKDFELAARIDSIQPPTGP